MTDDEFWALIEQSGSDGETLRRLLSQLSLGRIVEFDRCFRRMARRSDRWEVCAAAYLICDYVSDDSFSDFQSGLVSLGRAAFEQSLADPDSLADHPLVRAIAAGERDRYSLSNEVFGFAASHAYAEKTGDDEAFWEVPRDQESADTGWSGEFGGPGDAELIPQRLPKLYALFTTGRQDQGSYGRVSYPQ